MPLWAALSLFLVAHWDPAFAQGADLQLLVLNGLPFFLLGLLVCALSGRALFSLLLGAITVALVYSVNDIKLRNLAEPLLPGDLLMLQQVLGNPVFFLRYVDAGAGVAIACGLLALLWWLERPGWPKRAIARVPAAALAALLLASLAAGTEPWASHYAAEGPSLKPWVPRESALAMGMPAYFLRISWHSVIRQPAADLRWLDDVRARLDQAAGEASPDAGDAPGSQGALVRPDIIVFQSESFFDPGRLRGIPSEAHIPNLASLRQRWLSGDLVVPAYGGQTTRTEFEVLTGIPLRAFPGVQYPYQGLVHAPLHSLASRVADIGYDTVALHPYPASFYRRDVIYPRLGFERFVDLAGFRGGEVHGYFVSDDALVKRILQELSTPDEVPKLVYALSMENHGPWDERRRALLGDDLAPADSPVPLAPEDALALSMYLHHVRRSDEALGRLVDAVLQRERPTVLLYFGDHLPGLHGVFKTIEFRDRVPAWRQPVPYLVVDNRRPVSGRKDMRASELASLLMEIAGLPLEDHLGDQARLRRPHGLAEEEVEEFRIGLGRLALAGKGARSEAAASMPRVLDVVPRRIRFKPGQSEPTLLTVRARGLPDKARLVLDGETVASVAMPDGLVAKLPADLLVRLAEGDGEAVLQLNLGEDRIVDVGSLDILAIDERSPLGKFCRVEAWGPDRAVAGRPANPQPDGSEGFWVRLGCFPPRAEIVIDGQALPSYHQPGLLTARLDAARTQRPGSMHVGLRDPDSGDELAIGAFLLVEAE